MGMSFQRSPCDRKYQRVAVKKDSDEHELSNEKRAPGWLGYIGDEKLPSYIGHYFINHEIRIPINQPV